MYAVDVNIIMLLLLLLLLLLHVVVLFGVHSPTHPDSLRKPRKGMILLFRFFQNHEQIEAPCGVLNGMDMLLLLCCYAMIRDYEMLIHDDADDDRFGLPIFINCLTRTMRS